MRNDIIEQIKVMEGQLSQLKTLALDEFPDKNMIGTKSKIHIEYWHNNSRLIISRVPCGDMILQIDTYEMGGGSDSNLIEEPVYVKFSLKDAVKLGKKMAKIGKRLLELEKSQ